MPVPADVNTQADLAAAMATIRANAGISLGGIAHMSSVLGGQKISKTTASNIETVGKSLPEEQSLRAFLAACRCSAEVVEEWCRALESIRSPTQLPERPATHRKTAPLTTPDGDLWHQLFPLLLVRRMADADFAAAFPTLKALVENAVEALNAAQETGPAYTSHGVGHSIAVVRRIGELLGSDVRRLSCHETQLLILGAFFHDVGRVPTVYDPPSSRQLRQYAEHVGTPDLLLDPYRQDVPDSVLEDYCRWDRTRRLRGYLNQLPSRLFEWDGVPMRETLGVICERQATPVDSPSPSALPTVDVALCSSLLRLATRLELCSLQSADDIYRRLGIERRTTPRSAPEDLEWSEYVRHLNLVLRRRKTDYEVGAEAVIIRPVAEFDLRKALEALQSEFLHCRAARGSWKPQWRGLPLPSTVDMSNVGGIGYTYEKLTFELARDDVLELLGGTNLYGNHHAFVRELLQNAIDAVRLRNILDPAPEGDGVAISSWEEDGSIWFRIDDDGIGMDLHIIREYFLQVGRSYYNSEDLDRELRRNSGQRFSAISRFGIGMMSCFMVGDRIEVSTRKYPDRGQEGPALRLSINQREDFAMLRREGEGYDPMPTRPGDVEFDFREKCGTTVAVHIDGARHFVKPSVLLRHAGHFHFTNDCTLTLNGEEHAGIDLDRPLLNEVTSIRHVISNSRGEFTAKYLGKIRLWAIPLNLSKSSPDPRVRGQLVAILAIPPDHTEPTVLDLLPPRVRSQVNPVIRESLAQSPITLKAYANLSNVTVECSIEAKSPLLAKLGLTHLSGSDQERLDEIRRRLDARYPSEFEDLDVRVLASLREDSFSFTESYTDFQSIEYLDNSRWWSHNGVALPVMRRHEYLNDGASDVEFSHVGLSSEPLREPIFLVGNVGFQDELRPDLSLNRDEVRDVPFIMSAALDLVVRRAIRQDLPPHVVGLMEKYWKGTCGLGFDESVDLVTVLTAMDVLGTGWSEEAVLMVRGQPCTVGEISAMVDESGEAELQFERFLGYYQRPVELLGATLALRRLNLQWRVIDRSGNDGRVVASPGPAWGLLEGLKWFPPLFFMPYESGADFRKGFAPWNINHPVCQWLISRAPDLSERVPGYFAELRELFSNAVHPDSMDYYLMLLEQQDRLCLSEFHLYERLSGDRRTSWLALNEITLVLIRDIVGRIAQVEAGLCPPQEVMRLLEAAGLS